MSTKDFYRKQDCAWQTKVDKMCKRIFVMIFEAVAKRMSEAKEKDKLLDMGCGLGDFVKYKPTQVRLHLLVKSNCAKTGEINLPFLKPSIFSLW